MKIRLNRELYDRAAQCAKDVDEPVGRWLGLCLREVNRSKSEAWQRESGVVVADNLLSATREDSVVATITELKEAAGSAEIRQAIAIGVMFCESRMRPRQPAALREGVDYFIGKNEW